MSNCAKDPPSVGARPLAELQRKDERKIETVTALPGYTKPTAIASGNWHDHFGSVFEIGTVDGDAARTRHG